MGITTKAVAGATKPNVVQVAADAVPMPKPNTVIPKDIVNLELSVHNRYVLGTQIYEKGVCYAFTREQAEAMLMRQSDSGTPLFRYYQSPRGKVDRTLTRNADGVPVRDMTERTLKPVAHVEINGGIPTGVEIGDASELAEMGIVMGGADADGPAIEV